MSAWLSPLFLLLFAANNVMSCKQDAELVQMAARAGLSRAIQWARSSASWQESSKQSPSSVVDAAFADCVSLYEESEPRLSRLLSNESYSRQDALTWLSGAMASHVTCLDGLKERGFMPSNARDAQVAQNLTLHLRRALAFYGPKTNWRPNSTGQQKRPRWSNSEEGLLASWNAASSRADIVVAKDGSGNFMTINEAVTAISRMGGRHERVIIYVKSGVYRERVEIGRELKNLMFVGDGMDKTVVTGNQNVPDGATTLNSATFGVSGDGFWARDMTFENTAGPRKHQAVALRVSSDLSIFYRCSFKGYQDTLLAHSQRQFYRDCHIYGTVDFIFGDASAVFQNCDIYVRRPMVRQSNIITAQGRDDPNESTGISIVNCRVAPAADFGSVKGRFRSFLGRPWKKYSRTIFLKTDLDVLIDPKGWTEWHGDFALSTLYYGEYMNMGVGASTAARVTWPGYHVLRHAGEASAFTVGNFIEGDLWIPATGVPYWPEI